MIKTTIAVVGLCLLAILFFKGTKADYNQIKPIEIVANVSLSKPTPVVLKNNPFKDIKIKAKSAYILDITENDVLFEMNSKKQLPMASLTKIMTIITAKELNPENTEISISKDALRTEGDNGLHIEEKWKLDDLIRFTLLVSSNDGAYELAHMKEGFLGMMNENAKKIGLSNTYFMNGSGLDISGGVSGGYGTAENVAKMFDYAVSKYPYLFSVTKEKNQSFISLNNITHYGSNTNKIISEIPNVIASKTGLSELAGGNLIIKFIPKENHPVIIVVMGSTNEGRFTDMLTLVKATEKYYTD
ncbi:MAG: hypothetical protein NUV47_03200 [Patescibacteria group bacterium]|nr:hypothetical protein [Patescibacteria group bacterium]